MLGMSSSIWKLNLMKHTVLGQLAWQTACFEVYRCQDRKRNEPTDRTLDIIASSAIDKSTIYAAPLEVVLLREFHSWSNGHKWAPWLHYTRSARPCFVVDLF